VTDNLAWVQVERLGGICAGYGNKTTSIHLSRCLQTQLLQKQITIRYIIKLAVKN